MAKCVKGKCTNPSLVWKKEILFTSPLDRRKSPANQIQKKLECIIWFKNPNLGFSEGNAPSTLHSSFPWK